MESEACESLTFLIYVRISITYKKSYLMYKNIMNDLGQLRTVVSKSYIYNLIQNQTGLSIRTISHVLNHTKEQDTDSL